MATLVQRIAQDQNISRAERMPGHEWEAALELYLNGHLTLTQISNHYNMTSSQETELSYLKTEFDSRNGVGKLSYFHDVIAATTLLQLEVITESQFRTILNLPATSPTTSSTTTTTSTSTTTTTTAP